LVFIHSGIGWGENDSLKRLESLSNNDYVAVLSVEEESDGPGGETYLTISYRILKEFQEKNAGLYKIMITFYNAIDQPFDGKSKWINKRLSGGEIGQMRFVPPMYSRSYKVWLPSKNVHVPAGTIIRKAD
jgi:hypothetical protein